MNVIFPWHFWVKIAASICAIFAVLAWRFQPDHVLNVKNVWRAMSTGVSLGMIISSLIIATPAWRLLWKLSVIRKRLPLLDGRWRGTQSSNWPIIEAMKNDAKAWSAGIDVDNAETELPDLLDTMLEVTIKTSFFSISMDLHSSGTNYQNSILKAAVLTPATEIARGRFTYVFEGRVPRPKTTDVVRFDGAAELEIYVSDADADILVLKGNVWTNRNWTKGLNTAGVIDLTREENWSFGAFKGRG